CGDASCTNGILTSGRACNGAGTCGAAASTPCAPYVCGATACVAACATSADCGAGFFCSGTTCVARRSNGTSCAAKGECQSGNCVDGVCCDTACTGSCAACDVAGKIGACTPIPAGQDPGNECTDEGAAGCGHDGTCDGAGACRLYPSGTTCKATSCTGSDRTLASRCDGAGTCVASATQSCAPFVCGPGGDCFTSCSTGAECLAPNQCAAGSCGKKPIGSVCATAPDCASGFCEQGVCCGSACGGVCSSCALPGSEGRCSAVPAGQDPLG